MSELFRFVSLRGPAPLAEATLPFVVPIGGASGTNLELSPQLDRAVERAAARGWALSFADLDRLLDETFDGLSLKRLADGDTRLQDARASAERVVNAVARGRAEPMAGMADRATVHILFAEWCTRAAALVANDRQRTPSPKEEAANARDFFTRAVLSAPITNQSPMTMESNLRSAYGRRPQNSAGNNAAALRQALVVVRAARKAVIAALLKGQYLLISDLDAAALAGLEQVMDEVPRGELAMIEPGQLAQLLADLDQRARELVAALAAAGDFDEAQPYGESLVAGPRDNTGGVAGGQIAPIRLGVGDLVLAELQSTAYEYGDIAHIENVLSGEFRRREYKKSTTSESETFTLTEVESTAETDTQTTQRFELEKASKATLNDTLNINAGTAVSASYGPVSAQASFGLGSTTARETSQNQATKLAQEVVSKATQKVRQLSSNSRRTLTRVVVDDGTVHEMDNKGAGKEHVVGVYRWVNKLESLRLMDYGQRLMLGITIPEPGAYLRWLARTRVNVGGVAPPTVLRDGASVPLGPDDVTPDNFLTWVAKYSVPDATPPPPLFITQSVGKESDPSAQQEGAVGVVTRTDTTLTVPPGYSAVVARGTAISYGIGFGTIANLLPAISVSVGTASFTWNATPGATETSSHPFTLPLAPPGSASPAGAETSAGAKIPIAINFSSSYGFAVTIEIVFQRSDAGLRAWQLDTWSKIMTAYQSARTAAEDAASRGSLPGVTIAGANPLENRNIERTELKRFAIELLAGAVGTIDAVDDDNGARPHPNASRIAALEALTRTFEDAFEWEHMSWQSLDYFWAPEASWDTLATLSDPDPDHKAFLAAGAAKVTLPVRPGYETAVLFRLWTRRIWPGDRAPLPDIASAVALGAEVATSPKGAPQRGIPVVNGDWVERSPTDLVILQPEGLLNWKPPAG